MSRSFLYYKINLDLWKNMKQQKDANNEYKNIHKGHFERLRNQYNKSPDAFNEHQKLELILSYVSVRKDVNPLAHILINKFGSIANVCNAPKEELMSVNGVGEKTANYLIALNNLAKHLVDSKNLPDLYLKNRDDVRFYITSNLDRFTKTEYSFIAISEKGQYLGSISPSKNIKKNFYKYAYILATGFKNERNVRLVVIKNSEEEYYTFSQEELLKVSEITSSLNLIDIRLFDFFVITQNQIYNYESDKLISLIRAVMLNEDNDCKSFINSSVNKLFFIKESLAFEDDSVDEDDKTLLIYSKLFVNKDCEE